jgi:hypothetical protein
MNLSINCTVLCKNLVGSTFGRVLKRMEDTEEDAGEVLFTAAAVVAAAQVVGLHPGSEEST